MTGETLEELVEQKQNLNRKIKDLLKERKKLVSLINNTKSTAIKNAFESEWKETNKELLRTISKFFRMRREIARIEKNLSVNQTKQVEKNVETVKKQIEISFAL